MMLRKPEAVKVAVVSLEGSETLGSVHLDIQREARGAPYFITCITIINYCQIILVIISYSCSICFSSEHSDSYLKSLPEMLNDADQLWCSLLISLYSVS